MNDCKKAVIWGNNALSRAVSDALREKGWACEELYAADRTEENIVRATDEAAKKLGGLGACVWADLTMLRAKVKDASGEEFSKDPAACLFACRAAAKHMAASGGGRIVNVASEHAFVCDGMHAEYAMASAAVCALTRELAANYWEENIQAITVTVAFVDGLFPGELDSDQRQTPEEISLIGRRVTPEDVAKTIRFAVASKTDCLTGGEIRADAGYLTTQYRAGNAPFAVRAVGRV